MNRFLYLAFKSSEENSISYRRALDTHKSIIKAQGTARSDWEWAYVLYLLRLIYIFHNKRRKRKTIIFPTGHRYHCHINIATSTSTNCSHPCYIGNQQQIYDNMLTYFIVNWRFLFINIYRDRYVSWTSFTVFLALILACSAATVPRTWIGWYTWNNNTNIKEKSHLQTISTMSLLNAFLI